MTSAGTSAGAGGTSWLQVMAAGDGTSERQVTGRQLGVVARHGCR